MALSHLVVQYESNFCTVALQFMEEEKNYPLPSPATTGARGRPQSLRHLPGRCHRPGAPGQSWRGPLRCAARGLGCDVLAVFRHLAEWKGRGTGRRRRPLSPPFALVGKQARGHGGWGTRGQRAATSRDERRCCVAVGSVAR